MTERILQTGDLPVEIPVVEEKIEVSRRVVETGGAVRIRKAVHEDHVSITEPLRRDSVEITRKSIGREVDGPVPVRHDGDVTIYPVVLERLVTSKQLVLVEEIHVRRVPHVDHLTMDIALRREEAIVERRLAGSDEWSPGSNKKDSESL